MNHQPSLADAAADLRRCVYTSFSPEGFNDLNFVTFFNHAQNILQKIKPTLDLAIWRVVRKRLANSQNPNLSVTKRREDLLTVSILLQSAGQGDKDYIDSPRVIEFDKVLGV